MTVLANCFKRTNIASQYARQALDADRRTNSKARLGLWCALLRAYGYVAPTNGIGYEELNALHSVFAVAGDDAPWFLEYTIQHWPQGLNPTPSMLFKTLEVHAERWANRKSA